MGYRFGDEYRLPGCLEDWLDRKPLWVGALLSLAFGWVPFFTLMLLAAHSVSMYH